MFTMLTLETMREEIKATTDVLLTFLCFDRVQLQQHDGRFASNPPDGRIIQNDEFSQVQEGTGCS